MDSTAKNRQIRAILGAWAFGFALAGIYYAVHDVPTAGWRLHDVSTGETRDYPSLQSRVYDSSPENTTIFAASAASRLPRWKVNRTDTTGHRVECEVRSALGLLTDDVTVVIEPAGFDGNKSLVHIRSRARLNTADLGRNARHIADLQAAMDDKLPRL